MTTPLRGSSTGTETILMDYIKNDLIRDRKATISPNDDLLANGTIDSLGILQLVAFVDERLGIRIPDEDVTYDNFRSVSALAEYLSQAK
jgi:acyl carrier protein